MRVFFEEEDDADLPPDNVPVHVRELETSFEWRRNMKTKRSLSVGMVLVLAVTCVWTSAEPFYTAGFTVIPDNEAEQILGGGGRVCDLSHPSTTEFFVPCMDNGDGTGCLYGYWVYQMARYKCTDAESGECYEYYMPYLEYGECGWSPEAETCVYTSVDFEYNWYCQ
jgi:hypothetical protein